MAVSLVHDSWHGWNVNGLAALRYKQTWEPNFLLGTAPSGFSREGSVQVGARADWTSLIPILSTGHTMAEGGRGTCRPPPLLFAAILAVAGGMPLALQLCGTHAWSLDGGCEHIITFRIFTPGWPLP